MDLVPIDKVERIDVEYEASGRVAANPSSVGMKVLGFFVMVKYKWWRVKVEFKYEKEPGVYDTVELTAPVKKDVSGVLYGAFSHPKLGSRGYREVYLE